MSPEPSKEIQPLGFLGEVGLRARLVFRLLGDRRVNLLLKAIPVAGVAYCLVPDLLIGPFDDATVLAGAAMLFTELCPPEVVNEHMRILRGENPPPSAADPAPNAEEDIIDGEYSELPKDQ